MPSYPGSGDPQGKRDPSQDPGSEPGAARPVPSLWWQGSWEGAPGPSITAIFGSGGTFQKLEGPQVAGLFDSQKWKPCCAPTSERALGSQPRFGAASRREGQTRHSRNHPPAGRVMGKARSERGTRSRVRGVRPTRRGGRKGRGLGSERVRGAPLCPEPFKRPSERRVAVARKAADQRAALTSDTFALGALLGEGRGDTCESRPSPALPSGDPSPSLAWPPGTVALPGGPGCSPSGLPRLPWRQTRRSIDRYLCRVTGLSGFQSHPPTTPTSRT